MITERSATGYCFNEDTLIMGQGAFSFEWWLNMQGSDDNKIY